MLRQLSDAQKSVLASCSKSHPLDIDVRNWPLQNRAELYFSYDIIYLMLEANGFAKRVCMIPKLLLAAVSPTFSEHVLRQSDLDTFTFDVGHMDEDLQVQHCMALDSLYRWLTALCTPAAVDLQAPTFHSEIALRHIIRQLGMSIYLDKNTDMLILEAQMHTLQPWHITELLYARAIEVDAPYPAIIDDDPLLQYLAQRMIETMNRLRTQQLQEVYKWLAQSQNRCLLSAVWRLQQGKKESQVRGG